MELRNKKSIQAWVIAGMVAVILGLNYFTLPTDLYYHAVFRMLFYLPLVMAGFWFGRKGALTVCLAVSLLFSPYIVRQWQGLTLENFNALLEGLLYIITAVIIGILAEREKRERQARLEVERLAAIGKAVSEVAHDMKTPLMAIGGFAKQVSRTLGKDDATRKKLDIVIQETGRLESMVREMLDFGKLINLDLSQANLNEIVHHSIELSLPVAKEAGVDFETNPEASLPLLPLDVSRMTQVILNLVINAIQASPEGEKVRVKTSMTEKEVILSISDSGSGIDEEARNNIFQPFFSTKKAGTGLGLAIVKKIVEAHGGLIAFHPNPDKGVTFVVKLPLTRDKPDSRPVS